MRLLLQKRNLKKSQENSQYFIRSCLIIDIKRITPKPIKFLFSSSHDQKKNKWSAVLMLRCVTINPMCSAFNCCQQQILDPYMYGWCHCQYWFTVVGCTLHKRLSNQCIKQFLFPQFYHSFSLCILLHCVFVNFYVHKYDKNSSETRFFMEPNNGIAVVPEI